MCLLENLSLTLDLIVVLILIDFAYSQLPPQSTWQCRSLDKIYIYSRLESESSFSSSIAEYEADVTEAIISSLMPCTGYSVVVTFTNRDGRSSPGSATATETTDAAGKCSINKGLMVVWVSVV